MSQSIYLSEAHKPFSLADLRKLFVKSPQSKSDIFNRFLDYTFSRTKNNDFWQRPAHEIQAYLSVLWDFIQKRKPDAIDLKLIEPKALATNRQDSRFGQREGLRSSARDRSPESQFSKHLTSPLILISQKDARYIVDSLEMALNHFGLESFEILSIGGLPVQRNTAGKLEAIPNEDYGNPDYVPEDPVIIELPPALTQEKLLEIQTYLQKILIETHRTNDDQEVMRDKCQAIIAQLESHKSHLMPDEADEAITFLHWLLKDHFYFLGYRSYDFNPKAKNPSIDLISGSGLGLLKNETQAMKKRSVKSMPKQAQLLANAEHILVITKTNTKSHVHRPSYTDYISIKRFNEAGDIIGEDRFLGLFSRSASNDSVRNIPYLRNKIQGVLQEFKTTESRRLGQSVLNLLENYPREDMFQMEVSELHQVIANSLSLRERPVTRLIIRKDAYGRFYSCIILLPKEKISAQLAQKFAHILLTALHGNEISVSSFVSESFLGRLHFVVRVEPTKRAEADINFEKLETEIINAAKTWHEKLKDLLLQERPEEAAALFQRYRDVFSLGYQSAFSPEQILLDIKYIEKIIQTRSIAINLSRSTDVANTDLLNFKLFQLGEPTSLSKIVPLFENMGLEAVEENAYRCKLDGETVWISSYALRIRNNNVDIESIRELFQDLFFALWENRVENDALNALVLKCLLPWRLVAVLRAYSAYYKLIGVYSQAYLTRVLINYPDISKALVKFFIARFALKDEKDSHVKTLSNDINAMLSSVKNLEEDKVLRTFKALIQASLRVNYYQTQEDGAPKDYLSIKFESGKIPQLPLPHPVYEIYVYSPRFEAIHLRAAKVARGGIRWSDRHEDFRTEVLGLMKAQQVKNSVIVPGGSKGGFVLKADTSKMDRLQLQDEAIRCYQNFMSGLLDLTDNLVEGKVVYPPQVKRYDGDDPYLVVAADKGTATFSDYANAVAEKYHFWLGDAFASGGSQGYDHKKLGITARGAWISVEAHFKVLGINPAKDEFTAVGIGDMSGDVFGNGMLLSNKIKLVAAFNHMHIFIDPTPNAQTSFKERKRLFNLPRSTWADYRADLISKGGGIFERSAKTILLSPEIKKALDVNDDEMEPSLLIQAILKAPVDLLFNGGIGTYVKASSERNQDVGDKSNDALRVDGNQLRCRVVGEGGNLGFTQLARVEYAQEGGLIFTDFIDNSAGVDLSDHEVNIKILLRDAINKKALKTGARNELLSSMADEVTHLVLNDNRSQTQTLSYAIFQAVNNIEIYMRAISAYEKAGIVNRQVEYLPSEKNLDDRKHEGKGLTAPEIAVVMSYVKIDIKSALLKSNVPDESYFDQFVSKEFPSVLDKRFATLLNTHQLRREIIATQLTNQLLSETGVLFVERLKEETMAATPDIVRAYSIIRDVFQMDAIFSEITGLDFSVEQSVQHHLRKHMIYFLRRASRWVIRHQYYQMNMDEVIARLKVIRSLLPKVPQLLQDVALKKYRHVIEKYIGLKVPSWLITKIANVYSGYLLLDIFAIASQTKSEILDVAKVYFLVGRKLNLDWLRDEITHQKGGYDYWEALAQSSLRDKLDVLQARITLDAMKNKAFKKNPDHWLQAQDAQYLSAWEATLQQLQQSKQRDYVMYTVAINVLDGLVDHLE